MEGRITMKNFDMTKFRVILHELFMELADWLRSLNL